MPKRLDAEGAPCLACGIHSGGDHNDRCPLRGRLRLRMFYKQIVYENGAPKRDDHGAIVTEAHIERGLRGMSEDQIAEAMTTDGIEISKLSEKTKREILRGLEKTKRRGG